VLVASLLNSIPPGYGTIQDVYDSHETTNMPLLLVQDIHLNPEAQANIAAILEGLIDEKKIGMIGVEGAFLPFDFKRFRSFDSRVTKKVTDDLLKQGILSAPSVAGIRSSVEPPQVLGVDDQTHYQRNVEAYLSTRKQKDQIDRQLNEIGK